jgi:hypothetical protein
MILYAMAFKELPFTNANLEHSDKTSLINEILDFTSYVFFYFFILFCF